MTNNSKVSDHHAIIPTVELEKQEFEKLSKGEKDILLLISMQLLMATGAKQRISETGIRVSCGGEEFLAKGKTVLNPGWKEFEDHFRKMKKLTVSKVEKEIPLLSEGQTFVCENVSASQHFTSLPKTFTENSLLSAMETAGNDSFNEDSEKKGALSKEEFMSGRQFRNTFFDIFPHLICHYSAIIQVSCNLIKVITAGFQVTENLQDFRIIEDYFDTFF